jgi:PAS domain S-box-containing protein/diguanylate cyclase (GGDEF)-like protein
MTLCIDLGSWFVSIKEMERLKALDQDNFISKFESSIALTDFLNSIESMGVGLTIVDARLDDLPLVYVNKGFAKITGYSKDEVLMRNCRFLQGKGTDSRQVGKIRKAIKELKTETITLKNYRKDGSFFWNQFIISPILDKENKPLYFIGFQYDITKQVEDEKGAKQLIKQLSNFDQITGLMRINYFKEVLQTYIQERSNPFVIFKVNLNRFRNFNDSYGEQTSNEILIEVKNRLRKVFPTAPITRSFADDFIVLLKLKESHQLKSSLLAVEIALEMPYILLGEKVTIDYRIGISQFPENGHDAEQLLSYAALAMREAKNHSLVHHCFFNSELAKKLETRMNIEKNFMRAFENEEFKLYYQPKVSTETFKVVGMEALIRWEDPHKGMINPGDFIPIAEETGFISKLGEWVLLEACTKNKMWQEKGLHQVPVSVNVSAVQFMNPHFIETVKKVLKETELPAHFLELEITESLLIKPDSIIGTLKKLKSIGVLVSIDDFGTGYSSIGYLKNLPIDTLKIDRTFIKETPRSERDTSLLLSIIQLGKSLGISVLAEGVEVEEQVLFLRNSKCDHIQGFYFSRPIDEHEMEKKLST